RPRTPHHPLPPPPPRTPPPRPSNPTTRAPTETPESPPADALQALAPKLDPMFRLDHLVTVSRDRAFYQAWDGVLKRFVALRVHLLPNTPSRTWFMRE